MEPSENRLLASGANDCKRDERQGIEMTYCTSCGSQVAPDALFCTRCGTKVAQSKNTGFVQRGSLAKQTGVSYEAHPAQSARGARPVQGAQRAQGTQMLRNAKESVDPRNAREQREASYASGPAGEAIARKAPIGTVAGLVLAVAALVLACAVIFANLGFANSAPLHVDFQTEGGSPIESVEYAQGASMSAPQDPTREGYNFEG